MSTIFSGLDLDGVGRVATYHDRQKEEFGHLLPIARKYFKNCKERGYPDRLSKEVWRQIESFSGYSFCKAHSASFAAESFQSLYLKTYFPLEFMTAVINNFGGFYVTEQYVMKPVCVAQR
ncbi:MAG: hypothetical protein IPP49_04115 [Saprospiraceae bacterium]|nr:hypothetical protein [Saprospiraceae bacterium]